MSMHSYMKSQRHWKKARWKLKCVQKDKTQQGKNWLVHKYITDNTDRIYLLLFSRFPKMVLDCFPCLVRTLNERQTAPTKKINKKLIKYERIISISWYMKRKLEALKPNKVHIKKNNSSQTLVDQNSIHA